MDVTAVLGAATALVVALTTLVATLRNGRSIAAVHREVRTPPGTSLAHDVGRLVDELTK